MEIGVAVAQAQLWIILRGFRLGRTLLLGIVAALPPCPEELDPAVDLEGNVEVRSEIRRVIQCVLTDHIEPAIRDLTTAAKYKAASALPCPE